MLEIALVVSQRFGVKLRADDENNVQIFSSCGASIGSSRISETLEWGPHAARSPVVAFLAIAVIPVLFHLTIVETSAIPLTLRPSFGSFCKLGFVTVSAVTHWEHLCQPACHLRADSASRARATHHQHGPPAAW
jgi:hypothetical protein